MRESYKTFSKQFRIASWPAFGGINQYQQLFYGALKPHGVNLSGTAIIDPKWLKKTRDDLDAIHFHWPENLWRRADSGISGTVFRVIGLLRFLRLAKRMGLRCIWTMHNIEHHEGANWIDRFGYLILSKESDLLICHSNFASKAFQQKYRPSGRIVIMLHGNYDGIYPCPRSRQLVLRELGLNPERPVLCCVGMVRHYKGVDIAVDAVRRLCGQVQLIVGGLSHSYDTRVLAESLAGLNGAAFIDRWLSAQEFSDVVGASEAVLLPYQKVTGSGALLAAWTLGRGVVASDLPYFREISRPEPNAAAFFPVGCGSSLAVTILNYLGIPFEARSRAARRLADFYRWEHCIRSVAQIIDEWRKAGG